MKRSSASLVDLTGETTTTGQLFTAPRHRRTLSFGRLVSLADVSSLPSFPSQPASHDEDGEELWDHPLLMMGRNRNLAPPSLSIDDGEDGGSPTVGVELHAAPSPSPTPPTPPPLPGFTSSPGLRHAAVDSPRGDAPTASDSSPRTPPPPQVALRSPTAPLSSGRSHATSRSSYLSLCTQFQRRLASEVHDVLQRAAAATAPPLPDSSSTASLSHQQQSPQPLSATDDASQLLEDLGCNVACRIEAAVSQRLTRSAAGLASVNASTPAGSTASPTASPARGVPSTTAPPSAVVPPSPAPSTVSLSVPSYYFELLADYYADVHSRASVARLFPYWDALWGQEAFAPIFALLFHKWLVAVARHTWDEDTSNRFMLMLAGCTRVFWSDVHGGTRHFLSLFQFLHYVTCSSERALSLAPARQRADLHTLLMRFFLYYEDGAGLPMFLGTLPVLDEAVADGVAVKGATTVVTSTAPVTATITATTTTTTATTLVGSAAPSSPRPSTPPSTPPPPPTSDPSGSVAALPPSDTSAQYRLRENARYMVAEVVAHLRGVRTEASLLVYVRAIEAFSTVPLDAVTANRLQTSLYSFVTPGGPNFPTRDVRHAARATMDRLFPSGRGARTAVGLLFRLLHPYYLPKSLTLWAAGVASSLYSSCPGCCTRRVTSAVTRVVSFLPLPASVKATVLTIVAAKSQ